MPEHIPNIHPLFVHFPIALLTLGVGLDAASMFFRNRLWLDRLIVFFYLVGTGAAALTWVTGRFATDQVGPVGVAIEELIIAHRALATRTVLIFSVAAIGRVTLLVLRSRVDAASHITLRALLFLTAVFGGWLLVQTADRGGALVYKHGVGVAAASPDSLYSDSASTSSGREHFASAGSSGPDHPRISLARSSEGSITWSPTAMDSTDVGTVMEVVTLSPNSEVRTMTDSTSGPGLVLVSKGSVALLIPESVGDLQAELRIHLDTFTGSIGLVHHFVDEANFETFMVSTEGRATLVLIRSGKAQQLDSSKIRTGSESLDMSVLAAGTHLKGFMNEKTVAHGHRDSTISSGRCGLILEGAGQLRVLSLKISPSRSNH